MGYTSNNINGIGAVMSSGTSAGYNMNEGFYRNDPYKIVNFNQPIKEECMSEMKRFVNIYVIDLHPDVAGADSILYSEKERWLTISIEELWYEINLLELLKKHNEKRVKILDTNKTRETGKDTYLKPLTLENVNRRVMDIV